MHVSVVVCTYAAERYDMFVECVDSVLAQAYEPIELIIVVDGNQELYERIVADYANTHDRIAGLTIHNNQSNRGISYSRTKGATLATGDIVAFIDDDAIARPEWITALVTVYQEQDALAVGGYVAPQWVSERPPFFPAEFYWLVGCTEPGFADHLEEIRNGYGSNISYNRSAFLEIGGYDKNTGRKGDRHIQAHEAPAGIRLQERFGEGVVYTEHAVVDHQLFAYRGRFGWLVARSFWQGFSKRIMDVLYPDNHGDERQFLRRLYCRHVPRRLTELISSPSLAGLQQLIAIIIFTGAVAAGYLYGLTKRPSTLLRD